MQWQDLPELAHPEVKLGAELDIFYPSWAQAITIPNNTSVDAMRNIACDAYDKYMEKT